MKQRSRIGRNVFAGLLVLCLMLPATTAAAEPPKLGSQVSALTWNTFLGGSMTDAGAQAVAVDGDGYTYVIGSSQAAWSCGPTPCTVRLFSGGAATYSNGFVAKLSPSGVLLWNTFQGSYPGYNETNGVAVDDSGGLYITGWSTQYAAGDWTGAGSGAFIAKLNASDGVLQWVQFIDYSLGTSIVTDNNGNIYAVGQSFSAWGCANPVNCTRRPFTGGSGSPYDAYVAKLDAATGALVWNAFLGGAMDDWGSGLTLDSLGNVYVVGGGKGSWGSPVRAYNPGDGPSHRTDVFAAKLDNDGALQWNTFLGGDGTEGESIIYDGYRGIGVDGNGNAYVAGKSSAAWGCSPVACTVRAYTPYGTNESTDAFVAKLNADGALVWNTFLGAVMDDLGNSIAADALGHTYVVGMSWASWGTPVQPFTEGMDAFAAKLDTNGALLWNMFLGGSGPGNGLARDAVGNIYVTGTASWQTWGDPVRPLNHDDVFVAKLPEPPATQTKTIMSVAAQDGWLLESGETTNKGGTKNSTLTTLRLGDDAARKQYRSILSFNTGAALPDTAVISSVKLKFRRQGVVGGGNPVSTFQGFMVDIRKGTFGAAALELLDFQSKGTTGSYKTFGPYKPAADASGWHQIRLPAGATGYINKLGGSSGLTQIRLRFKLDDNNNGVANYLSLFSGDAAAASQPQLILKYYVP